MESRQGPQPSQVVSLANGDGNTNTRGFAGGSVVKNPPVNAGDAGNVGSIPGLGRCPAGGHGNPAPMFLPGECHGQRNLAGYSPWGRAAWDTEQLNTHIHHTNNCHI